MSKRTLTALRGSVDKWERIVAEMDTDRGMANCPLCQMFNPCARPDFPDLSILEQRKLCNRGCIGCPVRVKTGISFCGETPYADYSEDETIANAEAELAFLKSLLPAE